MKRRIVALVLVMSLLAISLVGCGEDASAAPGSTEPATVTVAVDTSELRDRGRITIFNGVDFVHEREVVDYVPGDPSHIDPFHNVYGIYAVIQPDSGKTTNWAVLNDGSIVLLETSYKLLPRDNHSFILYGSAKDERKMILTLQLDGTYALSVTRPGVAPVSWSRVTDAWTAYDTVYWLSYSTVYKLDWYETDTQPEIFCEDAYGVSHEMDEAEGALVPLDKANMSAYGRSDIYSPYGDRLSKQR